MDYSRNHEPDQQGIWFPYTGFRFKDVYDIKLNDGTIIKGCQPNGSSWYGSGKFKDSDVAEVRLKPDSELERWHEKGQARIDYQKELFKNVD